MKIEISFKDPDALLDCINDALDDLVIEGLTDYEREKVKEVRQREIQDLCQKWFEYGEYLRVEVDTEKETCKVIEIK